MGVKKPQIRVTLASSQIATIARNFGLRALLKAISVTYILAGGIYAKPPDANVIPNDSVQLGTLAHSHIYNIYIYKYIY